MSRPSPEPTAVQRARKGLHKALGAIFGELMGAGWRVDSADGPASMGDIEVQLSRGNVCVWLLHDRGTPLLESGSIAWNQAFPVTVWREWLSREPFPARLPIEDEVRMFRSDLGAIETALNENSVTPEELVSIGVRQLQTTPPWGGDK